MQRALSLGFSYIAALEDDMLSAYQLSNTFLFGSSDFKRRHCLHLSAFGSMGVCGTLYHGLAWLSFFFSLGIVVELAGRFFGFDTSTLE